jgi:hypothetical protein
MPNLPQRQATAHTGVIMIVLRLQFGGKTNFAKSFRDLMRDGKIRSFEPVRKRGPMTIRHKSAETPGVVEFAGAGGDVMVKLKCRPAEKEWRLLQAFIGSVMRHYRDGLRAIEISFT